MEGAQVKFGIRNFIIIGLMAMLFLVMAKVIFTKYPVPVVSQLAQSA